jgi:dTDP-4-dehydrorhamnose 3,5-epimerase-like enzyme
MTVGDCKQIELPVVADPQGNLAFADGESQVPFPISRVFYVYDVPGGAVRGGHSHRTLEQVVFCVSGRLEVEVDDGKQRRAFVLDDPRVGLYLPPMVWHDIGGFSPGTVYLVLPSADFDEADYIRDFDEYLAAVQAAEVDASPA